MVNRHLETPAGNRFDRNKMEISKRASSGTVPEPASAAKPESASPPETVSSARRRRRFQPVLVALTATFALLAVTALYLWRQELKIPSLSFRNTVVSGNYLRVGPISTTIRDNEVIRLSLEIGYRNDAAKRRLIQKNSRIRDTIVSVLTEPDTTVLLEKHQYEAVRKKIKAHLRKMCAEPIDEVYFSELLTY
jgi:flagellar basal body-associated protein FliL